MYLYFIQFGNCFDKIDLSEMANFLPHAKFSSSLFEFDGFSIYIAWRDKFSQPVTDDNIFQILENGTGSDGLKIKITKSRILIESSRMGEDFSCYKIESDCAVITNRLPLFYGTKKFKPVISNDYLRWMLYEGYVGGLDTIFSGVNKVPPSSSLTIDNDSGAITCKLNNDFRIPVQKYDFVDRELLNRIDLIISNSRNEIASDLTPEYKVSFPLSGGKDSRSCLAIVEADSLIVSRLWTRGTEYSTDVISAKLISKSFPNLVHELRRPSYFSPEESQVRRVISSIVNTQGMLSAYDFAGLSDERSSKRVMGRLIGLKGDCKSAADGDLKKAFNWPMSSNNLEYLNNDAFQSIQNKHVRYLCESLNGCTTTPFVNQLYDLFDIMVSRSSLLVQLERLSGRLSYPLFQGDFFDLSMSCPPIFTEAEVFHFLINHLRMPLLNSIPFADQRWNSILPSIFSGSSSDLLESAKLAVSVAPIRSSKNFPNLSNPLVGNHKLNVLIEFRKFLIEWLANKADIEGINKSKLLDDLNNLENNFITVFRLSALLTVALVDVYGADLFDFSKRDYVFSDVLASASVKFEAVDNAKKVEAYEALLNKHEKSIAALYCELNNIEL